MSTIVEHDPPYYVKYLGATKDQIQWGGNDDPRGYLGIGWVYELVREEIHSYHTKYTLREFPSKKFNSVSFQVLERDDVH